MWQDCGVTLNCALSYDRVPILATAGCFEIDAEHSCKGPTIAGESPVKMTNDAETASFYKIDPLLVVERLAPLLYILWENLLLPGLCSLYFGCWRVVLRPMVSEVGCRR